ncbi:hypothetical protein Tco_0099491 [Tanacetum coccineum]
MTDRTVTEQYLRHVAPLWQRCQSEVRVQVAAGQSEHDTWHLACVSPRSEELSEYINCPSWNRPIFYDNDDDEYTIIYSKPKAITPDLPIEEPDNSLNPSTFDALNDHSEILSDPNDDGTSSDDDDFEDIKTLISNSNIESLNDNSTPNCVLKSTSPFPIPVNNSFFEKSDTSLSYSDNSLPEFESFSGHTEETSSGSITTHANNSLPEYDSFHFEIEPDPKGEVRLGPMLLWRTRVHVP